MVVRAHPTPIDVPRLVGVRATPLLEGGIRAHRRFAPRWNRIGDIQNCRRQIVSKKNAARLKFTYVSPSFRLSNQPPPQCLIPHTQPLPLLPFLAFFLLRPGYRDAYDSQHSPFLHLPRRLMMISHAEPSAHSQLRWHRLPRLAGSTRLAHRAADA